MRCSPECRRRCVWTLRPPCSLYTCQSRRSWCVPPSLASRCPASDPWKGTWTIQSRAEEAGSFENLWGFSRQMTQTLTGGDTSWHLGHQQNKTRDDWVKNGDGTCRWFLSRAGRRGQQRSLLHRTCNDKHRLCSTKECEPWGSQPLMDEIII